MTKDRNDHVVAAASPSFCQSTILVDELTKLGTKTVINQEYKQFDENALIEFLNKANATIAIVGKEQINARVLAKVPQLKAIAKYGVGVDNINFRDLEHYQIKFGHTAGVNRMEVAEMVLGFAIGHFRRIFNACNEMQRGTWHKNGGRDLNSLEIGIIGLGHVGTAVAEIMKPFGPTIRYFDIIDKSHESEKLGVKFKSFDSILRSSDLVTLHVPLTEKTSNMISSEALATMKPNALLINTARGEVVDFDQAVTAVQNQKLGGFAADVFTKEPVNLSALANRENLYFTPHIAANSEGAVLKMGRSSIEWVKKFLAVNIG